ncbi:MAG TPA: glutathione transferase GstA [Caulobacteraceae bacterium]|nr:glutathione transferase GstA [Caulobacteraceae bacterium]
MILYFAPGACSLADHIALIEAGLAFDTVEVDLKTHKTADGEDYFTVNSKGYVPSLRLDDGQLLTENIAILAWIADQAPSLAPAGELSRYHLLETLAYISSEIHKSFKPFFKPGASDEDKAEAAAVIEKRLGYFTQRLQAGYLFGKEATVADAYLFVVLTWAQKTHIPLSAPLSAFVERMRGRAAVRAALADEGLA